MGRFGTTFFANLSVNHTGISFQKDLNKDHRKPWPPFPSGGSRPVTIHRYLIRAVGGGWLPAYQLARNALLRFLPQVEFDHRPLISLGSNGRGDFLLEAPEDGRTASAVTAFLSELDQLVIK